MSLRLTVIFLLLCAVASAQVGRRVMSPRPPNPDQPMRPIDHRDDGFAFCTLQFESDRMEQSGTGWATDYPRAGQHMLLRLPEITTATVTEDQWVVNLDDDRVFECPMIFASDVGTMNLSDDQSFRLNDYLTKGGLLWVDDFWGYQSHAQ